MAMNAHTSSVGQSPISQRAPSLARACGLACGVAGLILAATPLLAQTSPPTPPAPPTAAAPVVRTTGVPQRDTLLKMTRPVSNVDLSEQRLESVMEFIQQLTGADLEV